jgi:hypothetical protein
MAPVRKALTVLIAIATIVTSCESGAPGDSSTTTPADDQSPEAAEPDCSNQDAVISSPGAVRSGNLTGDVDGDGSDDRLLVAVDTDSPKGCQAFLVADTGAGKLAEEISDPDISFDLGLPSLESVVPVDARPGDEVVVRILAGASTLFVGLFTVHDGELERIELTGDVAQYGNLFPSGGSVGHLEGSDCVADRIVVSLALPKKLRYEVTRNFYTLSETKAEQADSETAVVRAKDLNRYPEFEGTPFSHCGIVE